MQTIKEIMSLLGNGTRVIYITSNHDEMLRRYSDLQIGNFQLTDKMVMEINGKMTWIFHGDVFDATTKGSAKFLAKLGGQGYNLLILINSLINCQGIITGAGFETPAEALYLGKKLICLPIKGQYEQLGNGAALKHFNLPAISSIGDIFSHQVKECLNGANRKKLLLTNSTNDMDSSSLKLLP